MPINENIQPVSEIISKEAVEDPAKATAEEKEGMLLDPKFIATTGCNEWTIDEKADFLEKGYRNFRSWEKPIIKPTVRPPDYLHDLKRGTIDIRWEYMNYSFCNVVIPDDSTVIHNNFSQIQPDTDCIAGENLTFIDCNLSNVRINPSWTLKGCNTSQFWLVAEDNKGEIVEVTQFVCSHPSELTTELLKPPVNAILERSF